MGRPLTKIEEIKENIKDAKDKFFTQKKTIEELKIVIKNLSAALAHSQEKAKEYDSIVNYSIEHDNAVLKSFLLYAIQSPALLDSYMQQLNAAGRSKEPTVVNFSDFDIYTPCELIARHYEGLDKEALYLE